MRLGAPAGVLARDHLDTVATVCGVERSLLERAYGAFAATGAVEGAGKVLAGPGLVQHGTGAQAARAAAVVQLLLGNIGVPWRAASPTWRCESGAGRCHGAFAGHVLR